MLVQGRCRAAAGREEQSRLASIITLILFVLLVSCAEAFIDIRAPEKDAAVLEAQPQTQVHLVFSSHLVSPNAHNIPLRDLVSLFVATEGHLTEGQSDRDRHPNVARTMRTVSLHGIWTHTCGYIAHGCMSHRLCMVFKATILLYTTQGRTLSQQCE